MAVRHTMAAKHSHQTSSVTERPHAQADGSDNQATENQAQLTREEDLDSVAAPQGAIDLNTATPEELTRLRGIGPAKAQAILEHRPYKSVDDLREVKGIKDGTLEEIKDQITVS